MQLINVKSVIASAWLKTGVLAGAFALCTGAFGHAKAATPTEVDLATPAQALTYCQAGSLAKGYAYINGAAGDAQYAKKCIQAVPKKNVKYALLANGNSVSSCKLATAAQAIALCNAGGIGEYDIAYIRGPAATVIGGPGYGCTTNITNGGIGNAICQ